MISVQQGEKQNFFYKQWFTEQVALSSQLWMWFCAACQWTMALCSKCCSMWEHAHDLNLPVITEPGFTDKMRTKYRMRYIMNHNVAYNAT